MTSLLNPLRRSYEARVLVVPLDSEARELVTTLAADGVTGVQVLTMPDPRSAETTPLGSDAWVPPSPAGTAEIAAGADMVVLLGVDLAGVPEGLVHDVSAAAREHGDLIAAVLVAPQNWEDPRGASAMVTLRQEVDMLISVRGTSLVAALLDVLRGGARNTDPQTLGTPA